MSAAPPPADTPPLPTLTYRQTLVILSGLFLCMFLAALDQTAIAIALPAIAADLAGAEYLS